MSGLCQQLSGQGGDRDVEKRRGVREAGRVESTAYFSDSHAEREASRQSVVRRLPCQTAPAHAQLATASHLFLKWPGRRSWRRADFLKDSLVVRLMRDRSRRHMNEQGIQERINVDFVGGINPVSSGLFNQADSFKAS